MRRRGDVAWTEVDSHVVGLDLWSSRYFSLNATGSVLWELLAGDRNCDDLVDAIVDRYGVNRQTARDDVEQFVSSMRVEGLVEG